MERLVPTQLGSTVLASSLGRDEEFFVFVKFEPRHVKTSLWGFRPVVTQIGLYSHRSRQEA